MSPWLHSLLRRTLATWHGLGGRILFRIGCAAAARRHFERVLHLRGDDFAAYVHLGRLAYSLGDYAGWRREFEHARRTDPSRFLRLRMPFELFEPRAAGTPFDEASERATWRAVRPGSPGSIRRTAHGECPGGDGFPGDQRAEAREASLDASLDPHSDCDGDAPGLSDSDRKHSGSAGAVDAGAGGSGDRPAGSRHGSSGHAAADDFSSANERSRFRRLAPIRRQDVARTDLDELIRRLSG